MDAPISRTELFESYQRAALWRFGLQFEDAIDQPLLLSSMRGAALARRRKAEAGLIERLGRQQGRLFEHGEVAHA